MRACTVYGGDTRVMLCPCGLLASFGARVVRVCFVQLGRGAGEWGGVLDERCETQRNASHGFTGRVALLQTPFPAVLRCRSVWTFFMDCICRASPLRPLGKSKVSPVDVTGHWSVPLTLPAATLWLRVCPSPSVATSLQPCNEPKDVRAQIRDASHLAVPPTC